MLRALQGWHLRRRLWWAVRIRQPSRQPNRRRQKLRPQRQAKQTEDQIANLAKLKAELASATGAEIMKNAELLWTAKDYSGAVALSEMALKKDGNRNASYRLGTAYYSGLGVEKNLDKAWEFLGKPELDDVGEAHYFRGLMQADKLFSGFDVAKARASFEKAREKGVADADAKLKALPQ